MSKSTENDTLIGLYVPRHSAASRWRSGQALAVKLNTAGAVMTTDKPCG